MHSRDFAIDTLRKDIVRENNSDPHGGGWSDFVIEGLRPGHRDLRDSLENIATASDAFATPRQRALARQALGLTGTSVASHSGTDEADEVELLEGLADGL